MVLLAQYNHMYYCIGIGVYFKRKKCSVITSSKKKKSRRGGPYFEQYTKTNLRILLYHLINMYRQFDMVGQLVKTIFTELILINVPHLGLDNQITTLYFTVGMYQ